MLFYNNQNLNFKLIFLWFFLLIFSNNLFSQDGNVIINMDTTLVKLIDLKKELNSEIENYKIQIFSGKRSDAENTISEYKILYNDSAAIIRYEAPNYKIWIGNYYTLVEAEKEILEVRKKYPNAFIFKPNKLIKFENEKLSRNGGN
tara:strand:- start:233 stop:670 length:438 start_codon:yes stop_codon:yes gene_type:complete